MEEQKLLGSILLPSYKILPCLSEDGIARKFAFKAEHSNMKTYYFAADTKETMTQWMNSLSLASIMQLPSAFSSAAHHQPQNQQQRNQGDGQEGVGTPNNDDEESGFASYQSRRSTSMTPVPVTSSYNSNDPSNIGSGDKYPGSYNSVGLPIAYQHQIQRPIQRQTHYVNAPPKPKRQYYDASELYCIPPSAQYHQSVVHSSMNLNQNQNQHQQATPDLIAHDSFNSNYLPSGYYSTPPSYHAMQTYDQLPHQYNISHSVNSYNGHGLGQSGQPKLYSRLPPRPHSADFLERDQDEDEDYQQEKLSKPNDQSFYPQSPPEPPKILPIRPKSSMERYDPYYSKYYLNDNLNYSSIQPTTSTTTTTSHKEPRPWSDYLAAAAQAQASGSSLPQRNHNDNQMLNSSTTTYSTLMTANSQSNGFNTNNSNNGNRLNYNQYSDSQLKANSVREESLQRLHEWKQRMLQSPLNKRNWQYQQQQGIYHNNNVQIKNDLPSRPPLPEEYRNKFTIRDALINSSANKGSNQLQHLIPQSHPHPLTRDRSKSVGDGSEFNGFGLDLTNPNKLNRNCDMLSPMEKQAPISYSSDDEGKEINFYYFSIQLF